MKKIKIAELKAKIAADQANKLKKIAEDKYHLPLKKIEKMKTQDNHINKEINALIKIQSTGKMYITRKKYKKVLAACLKIQNFFKRLKYIKLFQKIRSAACFIQYMYRKYKKNKRID